MSNQNYIEHDGEVYFLGMNQPETLQTQFAPLLTAPNFVTWSRSEIVEAVKNKPVKRRKQFADSRWRINQLQRGSCASAATTLALYRALALAGRDDIPPLAWEFLYAQVNGGRDNGSLLEDNMKAVTEVGIPPLDLQRHPVNRHIQKRDYSSEDYRDAANWVATNCFTIDSEDQLCTLLLSGQGAAVVAVDVDNSFMQMDSRGIAGGGDGVGNHAVCVDDVELIDGEPAFDNDGSWGQNVHEGGRVYLTWKRHFRRTPQFHRFFAIMAGNNPGPDGPVVVP